VEVRSGAKVRRGVERKASGGGGTEERYGAAFPFQKVSAVANITFYAVFTSPTEP
jgi:hypothetical protein